MTPSWSVVTVTYNSSAHLAKHWADRSHDYEWIVVDNESSDSTLDLAKDGADVVIRSGGNLGFSRANNIGLSRASGDFVIFVNPDVSIQGSVWQTKLANLSAEHGSLVAPQLLNSDLTLQSNARGLPYLSAKIRNRIAPTSKRGADYARSGFDAPTYCAWAMGAAIGGPIDLVRELGGWDENYFLYYEDHEMGLNAWSKGSSVLLEPSARWVHDWQRETTRPSLAPWKAEFASMRTFYSAHPEFLRKSTRHAHRAGWTRMSEALWTTAVEGNRT